MSELDEIRQQYLQKMPERIQRLEAIQEKIRGEDSSGALLEARDIAHKIRGSAGTYGFSGLSVVAEELEGASELEFPARLSAVISAMKKELELKGKLSRQQNILLIEDDPDIHRLFKWKLAETGCRVSVAINGKSALQLVQGNDVDLLFLDLTLPDMDGRQFLKEIRANPKTERIPVYVVSGVKADRVKSECLFLGATDYIEKPFDPERLLAILRFHQNSDQLRPEAKDGVTGLANRGALRNQFREQYSKMKQDRMALSISILQIDNLRAVTEKHGVAVSDGILRQISAGVAQHLTGDSFIGRSDAEHFVVLWPQVSASEAQSLTEKIVRDTAERTYEAGNGSALQIKMSAAVCPVGDGQSFDQALQEAEVRLYEVQREGRSLAIKPAEPAVPLKQPRILVADDDDLIVSFIRHRLSREGFEILSSVDGAAALEIAEKTDIGLFILDVQMPGINGIDLLTRLRQLPRHKETPVVMLTAMGNEKDIALAFEKGANDYLVKPFSPIELQVRIRRFVG